MCTLFIFSYITGKWIGGFRSEGEGDIQDKSGKVDGDVTTLSFSRKRDTGNLKHFTSPTDYYALIFFKLHIIS